MTSIFRKGDENYRFDTINALRRAHAFLYGTDSPHFVGTRVDTLERLISKVDDMARNANVLTGFERRLIPSREPVWVVIDAVLANHPSSSIFEGRSERVEYFQSALRLTVINRKLERFLTEFTKNAKSIGLGVGINKEGLPITIHLDERMAGGASVSFVKKVVTELLDVLTSLPEAS